MTLKSNFLIAIIIAFFSVNVFSQEMSSAQYNTDTKEKTDKDNNKELELEEIITTGSRVAPRSNTSSPLPVDNFSFKDIQSSGQPTFDKALQYRVPSFNSVNTPVNDATTLLDPWEIRNLGPSRTLILINGKRKNLSSLLYVQFSPGRGETGVDISAIPTDAIKNVEILRDGASAQYGSDAIAGVMNIILKDKFEYSSLNLNAGITSQGDGFQSGLSFNSGKNIKKNGFLNYTIAFNKQFNAVRSGNVDAVSDNNALGSGDAAGLAIVKNYLQKYPTANNINGTGDITGGKGLINFGMPLNESTSLYANAAVVVKYVISNANYRTPYWKKDEFNLLHSANSEYIGFMPTFEGLMTDFNATFGVKKELNGWKHDFSITTGGNLQSYTVNNTLNFDMGAKSPTSFKPGGYGFNHYVGNYDISKNISKNIGIAFGIEGRYEAYSITAGDTASYYKGGSNSFGGLNAINAGTFNRFNIGAYADLSWDINNAWVVNATVRGENYSDFGGAFVYKFSSRYNIIPNVLTIRGSYSTGFRAPTLHQIYAQSVQSAFVNGSIQLSGLFNNKSAQAQSLQVPSLKPEQSINVSGGIAYTPNKNLSFTVDYYDITISDRIIYSSSISGAKDDSTSALAKILKANSLKTISFFINGVSSYTNGLDFVASYKNIKIGTGKLGINLAGNYTINNLILGNTATPAPIKAAGQEILDYQIKSLLTKSRPQYKVILGLDYSINKLNINLNNTLFGETEFQDRDNGGDQMANIKQVFTPNVVTDLTIAYNFSPKFTASITINNLLNILPTWNLVAINSTGQKYLDDKTKDANGQTNYDKMYYGLTFSGRYRILGYNGSQFSQLGTMAFVNLSFRF